MEWSLLAITIITFTFALAVVGIYAGGGPVAVRARSVELALAFAALVLLAGILPPLLGAELRLPVIAALLVADAVAIWWLLRSTPLRRR